MADITFNISFDLASALDLEGVITKKLMPYMHTAVDEIGKQLVINWQDSVNQAKLSPYDKQEYIKSITWTMNPSENKGIAQADYRFAQEIETGRPARDLKRMLSTSTKVRRTKSGKRFLVIPMRHNVAKLQSAGLYDSASGLQASIIASTSKRLSGEVTNLSPTTGMSRTRKQPRFLSDIKTRKPVMVSKNNYQWGDRLKGKNVPKNFKGLYRFDTSTPKAKSSSFLTFRIMMEGQSGWIIPPQPATNIVRNLVADMKPKANAAFAGAIKKSLAL